MKFLPKVGFLFDFIILGLPQLLNTRTSRKFLASRMTIDMENKLAFLALKVKFGLQKRYQDWFFRQVN